MIIKTMKKEVIKIYLSSEKEIQSQQNHSNLHTDVVVEMENGDKLIASFFSYQNLETLKSLHQQKGAFLGGKYFWVKGMLMVEKCNRENIEMVIKDLMDEGDFKRVFRKIN